MRFTDLVTYRVPPVLYTKTTYLLSNTTFSNVTPTTLWTMSTSSISCLVIYYFIFTSVPFLPSDICLRLLLQNTFSHLSTTFIFLPSHHLCLLCLKFTTFSFRPLYDNQFISVTPNSSTDRRG